MSASGIWILASRFNALMRFGSLPAAASKMKSSKMDTSIRPRGQSWTEGAMPSEVSHRINDRSSDFGRRPGIDRDERLCLGVTARLRTGRPSVGGGLSRRLGGGAAFGKFG
jgi:hypothetical protein